VKSWIEDEVPSRVLLRPCTFLVVAVKEVWGRKAQIEVATRGCNRIFLCLEGTSFLPFGVGIQLTLTLPRQTVGNAADGKCSSRWKRGIRAQ